MELKKKIVLVIVFIASIILFINTNSYAGTQSWNAIDYNVTLNLDGSMDVVETLDVSITETNTLFKTFKIDDGNYNITNVKVSRVENGRETYLEDINMQQYHVDLGCYYGLKIDSSTFEIAWNVGLDNSRDDRVYKVYYTVDNAVKVYNDCTELYWQFVNQELELNARNITGTIKLPNEVSDEEKLRVWAHGNYTGEITKKSKDEVIFSVNSLTRNEMLEVRIVTEENIYTYCPNQYNQNRLEKILEEEQYWADEANAERERVKKAEFLKYVFIAIMFIINIIILVIVFFKCKKYKKIRKELEEKYSLGLKYDLEYFRDIPDEKNATPAKAAYMYNFKKNVSSIQNDISKIFSATMLDLSLKGLIAFETISEKEVRILRTSNTNIDELSEDEKLVYELLKSAMLGKDSITPKEFSKYAAKEYDTVYTKLNKLDKVVKELITKEGKISEEKSKISKQWNSKFGVYFVLCILSTMFIMFLPALTVGLFVLANACRKNSICISILNENGIKEIAEWKGLKKYMEDYSLLKEKLVPDIVLWEKYLVYATVFGISKKVINQLKSVHPEMFEETNNEYRSYAYWHMMTNSNFGVNNFDDFSRSLEKVYNSAQSAYSVAHSSSSSGSGGGGGFSGGGGGRRWRWKLWRTLKIELNIFENIC